MSRLLPTPLDLRMLRPRALVAFAVRCCRRIQPLYDLPHDQPHPTSLEGPLCAAESFARGDAPEVDPGPLIVALNHASRACHYSAHAWALMEPWEHRHRNDPAANAAAAYALNEARDQRKLAAAEAEEAARALAAPAKGDLATLVAQIARTATHVAATHVAVKARPAVAADFEKLRDLGVPGSAPDEPLDSSESGPLGSLWPAGEPVWASVRE